jgi:hypothetical protein
MAAGGKVDRETDEQPEMSRSQLSTGNENISDRQKRIPRSGIGGTSGQRKGRGASGSLRRMISTAVQTMVNASSAPIFSSSASMRRGKFQKGTFRGKNRAFSFGGSVVSASI